MRWFVGIVGIVHGLIHLLGAAKGFGWAEVSQLAEPINAPLAVAWLVVAVLVVVAAGLTIVGTRGWWVVAAVAAVGSQLVIATSWTDARAGTVANVLLAGAALYGCASRGPVSLRARYRQLANEVIRAATLSAPPVVESDLAHLPAPIAEYVRSAGAVGRPRVVGFRAVTSGRIRADSGKPWMRWHGEQVNTFGTRPSRVFVMYATMKGIPIDILHIYIGSAASMQVRVASMIGIVDARGQELTQAETVTLLNDLCVLAPAALVDAPIDWTPIDDLHARATYSNAGHTVSAVLTFNEAHDLVDFESEDRLRTAPGGQAFIRQRWSTPITEYRDIEGRRSIAFGTGRWHPDDAAGFDYVEFRIDDITYLEAESVVRAAETGRDLRA